MKQASEQYLLEKNWFQVLEANHTGHIKWFYLLYNLQEYSVEKKNQQKKNQQKNPNTTKKNKTKKQTLE